MTLRLAALVLVFAAPAALAQSLPDWAAPTPYARDTPAASPIEQEPLDDEDLVPPPPPIPVDGGLALLALAGAGLAARKLRS